ncbi:hypothetical protein HDU67_004039 [Dinochytrium kinnereticum]|nr:hypothetical protein HDU67_004039 [Dinochytrium kinnereticum]
MATGAPTPDPTPWFELAAIGPDIPRDGLNRLIYEHLLHNCYSDTAAAFAKACQLNSIGKPSAGLVVTEMAGSDGRASPVKDEDVDMMDAEDSGKSITGPVSVSTAHSTASWSAVLGSLEARKRLCRLLCEGKVGEAIQFCKMTFPSALSGSTPESVDVCFQLQCQQFIENVRVSAPEAVKFAQSELGQFGNLGPKYIEVLQDIVALIAYKDPFKSPVARFLSQERREEVASNVNNYILASENLPSQTKIEKLVTQLITVTDTLHEQSLADKKNPGSKFWNVESGSHSPGLHVEIKAKGFHTIAS